MSAYTLRDYPVEVKLRQNLSFQASVKSKDKALSVLAENCYSTPSQDKKDNTKYYLIVNGLVFNMFNSYLTLLENEAHLRSKVKRSNQSSRDPFRKYNEK